MKIVFFGTPEFAVASLDALVKNGFDVAAVVTMPDKAAGRGQHISMSDVKKYALEHNLPLLQAGKTQSTLIFLNNSRLSVPTFLLL